MSIENELICNLDLTHKNGKIASFDLDGTLIKTKSGRIFAKDKNDWIFFNDNVCSKLKELHDKGFDIVIFTNQKQLCKKPDKQKDFIEKITNIITKINLPISYFISVGSGYYRKPCTGPFDVLINVLINGLNNQLLHKDSFYCGDAGGRNKGWKYIIQDSNGNNQTIKQEKKDFSASDYYFANNIGLTFVVPEQLFFNTKKYTKLKLPIRSFLNNNNNNTSQRDKIKESILKIYNGDVGNNTKRIVIIMIGFPASGKSHLSQELLSLLSDDDSEILNLDTIKNQNKLRKRYKSLIEQNYNIIVDNTNVKKEDRQFYIDNSSDNHVVVGINFLASEELLKHLNMYRTQKTKNQKKKISTIVYNMMKKKHEKPQKEEGFHEIFEYDINSNIATEESHGKEFFYYY